METKRCSKCSEVLPLIDFNNQKTKNGIHPTSWCKTCIREYVKEYRLKKKTVVKKRKTFVEKTLTEEDIKKLNDLLLDETLSKKDISLMMRICYTDVMNYYRKLQKNKVST